MEIAPNRIELSTLTGGFTPDPPESGLTPEASPDINNLLPDRHSDAVEIRKGYSRLSAGRVDLTGFFIRHLNYYETIDGGTRKRYLIAVFAIGTGAVAADNIRIFAYDLSADTFTRIDTAGRTWAKPKAEHWTAIIDGTYYGGTRGEAIYSWHPTDGWNAAPTTPNVRDWVDAIDAGVNTATQFGRDFAFKKGQQVEYVAGTAGDFYTAARGIRFKTWEDGQHYNKGERVSVRIAIGGSTYWRSYQCILDHTAVQATNRPGDGSSYTTNWKKVRLQNIENAESETTSDWFLNPIPRKSSVGAFHGFRLWVRSDNDDQWTELQYSAPMKPEKGEDIANLTFDPTDWAFQEDLDGNGGGRLPVPFTSGDAIRALYSYGNYFIIAGRWQSFVLIGLDENSWTLRELGKAGSVNPSGITEHEGLVYMLSPAGTIYVTDGTAVREIPGVEKIREWLKERMDATLLGVDTFNLQPYLKSYGRFLLISFPDEAGTDYTVAYDPETESFWPLDIPTQAMATGVATRAQRLYFSASPEISAGVITAGFRPCVFEYKDRPGSEVYTDDDPFAASASASTNAIAWHYRSAWFQFGSTRNERRIRRAWAIMAGVGGETVTVRGYRNFITSTHKTTVDRVMVTDRQSQFIEGKTQPNSYAVGLRLSGSTDTELAIMGLGVDTEPIRTRFHRGAGT